MEYFWAVIVCIVLLMIIIAWVQSTLRNRRPSQFGETVLAAVPLQLDNDRPHNFVLNSGAKFIEVRVAGFSQITASAKDPHLLAIDALAGPAAR